MTLSPSIVWLRDDFRLGDNHALLEAAKRGAPLLCITILDDAHLPGAAACWWLDGAIRALDADLRRMGGALHVLRGASEAVMADIVQRSGAGAMFWNRRYDPKGRDVDTAIKAGLKAKGVTAESFPGALLHEPWSVQTKTGGQYKVFTAFWRAACALPEPFPPSPAPKKLTFATLPALPTGQTVKPAEYGLLPVKPDWAGGFRENWTPGEAEAHGLLAEFLKRDLSRYAERRDFPGEDVSSRLSPYLRFGQITPAQIWHAATQRPSPEKFLSELRWRDFAWSILFFNAELATRNLREDFDAMSWRDDPKALVAWQQGRTGYPLVDAGMRELWHTGWMHNRVRMVVASFLVKHLLIDWRAGERWFADTLVDHDLGSNPMNWQWNAGTGVDAAPYFRIMNPILQSQKFDPKGVYIRRWVPELAHLSDEAIHMPWDHGGARGYPAPIVEHRVGRERALAAWKALSG